MWNDLRFAFRTLRRSPGFSLVAILSLALGIGANTAIFSLLYQVVLRSVPVHDPQTLVTLASNDYTFGWTRRDNNKTVFSYSMYRDLRDRSQIFGGLIARASFPAALSYRGDAVAATAEVVTGNFFEVLGLHPALGRPLLPADDGAPGWSPAVVLSYSYWASHLGADPSVLNTRILMNGQPVLIVGVAPRGFRSLLAGQTPDFFVPVAMMPQISPGWQQRKEQPDMYWLSVFGRLKPGVTPQRADAALPPLYHALLQDELPRMTRVTAEARRKLLAKPLTVESAALTLDNSGNLYGSTTGNYPSIGSIFKLTPTGGLKVRYAFTDGRQRLFTTGKLILDRKGDLYGVDQTGGTSGDGSIFKLTPSGVFTVLYSFTGQGDGAFPNGVIADAQGHFYGTANQGGVYGQGTVFEFTTTGVLKVLYSFMGKSDGGEPFDSAPYRDPEGNLYGTTMYDGGIVSLGVVFKVTPEGNESVLHTFTGGSDGGHPKGSLIADREGNLYGTTSSGEGLGGGTVFQITPAGVKTELHTFSDSDGYDPNAGLAVDTKGNLYGTTFSGGSSNDGVVFEITPEEAETVLHNFSGSNDDGTTPYIGLIINQQGTLFGTTGFGGPSNQGTVFQVTP